MRSAEGQLQPTGVGNLARHFISDDHRAERINSRRDGIENEQRRQRAVVANSNARRKEFSTGNSGPSKAENKNRQNQENQQQGSEQHRAPLGSSTGAAERARRNRKHGIDHRPRAHVHQPPHQRDRGVESGFRRGKEMLHQNDIEVVDDGLAGEENDGLQPFSEGNRNSIRKLRRKPADLGIAEKICDHHRQHAGQDRATNSQCRIQSAEKLRPAGPRLPA